MKGTMLERVGAMTDLHYLRALQGDVSDGLLIMYHAVYVSRAI